MSALSLSSRVVYQWEFAPEQHDNKATKAMVTKAEKVADGSRPMRREAGS
ncbi:hypothetical protein [Pengzhenrongella sicca]|uniref:Uncharacterized protein n=1 Tax=Pengzhenrongella sicca TaxID=2819238 RepID=A0A8A4Z9K5_9MICO|nr:hypothetical protein [Pengzhenrongella sicca]QTE28534.1 hypothetical protein J4E96_14320 [Pengzhenrongella sicca]